MDRIVQYILGKIRDAGIDGASCSGILDSILATNNWARPGTEYNGVYDDYYELDDIASCIVADMLDVAE